MHFEAYLSLHFALGEIAPSSKSIVPPFLESRSYTYQSVLLVRDRKSENQADYFSG
jgi:hypothetical protein